jgi:galactose mutarotase-like enzyme
MNFLGINFNKKFKIKTIYSQDSNAVSFSPDRGGMITSLKLRGEEILYFDEDTFKDKKMSVRGGIPILFPNVGLIPDELKDNGGEKFSNLKQHGFARNMKWSYKKIQNGFIENIKSNNITKKVYPYDFDLTISGFFEKDGTFTIYQSVKNLDKIENLPISSGLHPYFKVSNSEKKNIKFNFKGGYVAENKNEEWINEGTLFLDNVDIPIEIIIPDLGILTLNISKEYKKIWIWSQKGKDFICIEPAMRDLGGIVYDPVIINPSETYSASFNIKLTKIK